MFVLLRKFRIFDKSLQRQRYKQFLFNYQNEKKMKKIENVLNENKIEFTFSFDFENETITNNKLKIDNENENEIVIFEYANEIFVFDIVRILIVNNIEFKCNFDLNLNYYIVIN